MIGCGEARLYTGALADGELEAVPDGIRHHVEGCPDCRRERDVQGEIQLALVAALSAEYAAAVGAGDVESAGVRVAAARARDRDPRPLIALAGTARTPSWLWLGAAAILILALGAGLFTVRGWLPPETARAVITSSADGAMLSAVRAYGSAVDYTSADPVELQNWCASHGSPVKLMALAGEVPVGTRMRMISGSPVVTIVYAGGGGALEMSALPARVAAGWPSMEAKAMGGRAVGMVHRQDQVWIIVAASETELMKTMAAMPPSAPN